MPDPITEILRFQLDLIHLASALLRDRNSNHAEARILEGLMQVCVEKKP